MTNEQMAQAMASLFERKKNANNFARVSQRKTGLIDPLKLYSYKLKDDIFLKKTIVPRQKNHGFIVIVDTSTSMSPVFKKVIEHLYMLSLFCKLVSVPYHAFSFSDSGKGIKSELSGDNFRMVELFNSKISKDRMKELKGKIDSPSGFTPLSSAIHYTKYMVRDFISSKRLDICNVIFITDGGCTENICCDWYMDEDFKVLVPAMESITGQKDSTGPLFSILRQTTGANVWAYYIQKGSYRFEKECGGTNGTFFIPAKMMNNPRMFMKDFIDRMVNHDS